MHGLIPVGLTELFWWARSGPSKVELKFILNFYYFTLCVILLFLSTSPNPV